jgi:hypothetical protein
VAHVCYAASFPRNRFALETLVDFVDTFPDQENTTKQENKIAPGKPVPGKVKERSCQAHDPSQRQQQQDASNHCQGQAKVPRSGLLCGWQSARENANEDDVVDPEHDLENSQRDKSYPTLWGEDPIHLLPPLPGRCDGKRNARNRSGKSRSDEAC